MKPKTLSISSKDRIEIIDITKDVENYISEINLSDGFIILQSLHTTVALIVNENESRLKKDILNVLDKLISQNGLYLHDQIDNNADSHIKSILLSQSQFIPIKDNKLVLGTWQSIMFVELDGPRNRKIFIQPYKS